MKWACANCLRSYPPGSAFCEACGSELQAPGFDPRVFLLIPLVAILVMVIYFQMHPLSPIDRYIASPPAKPQVRPQQAPPQPQPKPTRPVIGMTYEDFKDLCLSDLTADDDISTFESASGYTSSYNLVYTPERSRTGCYGYFRIGSSGLESISR